MPDNFDRATRSRIMAAVRSTENVTTEIKFVRILRAHRITGWRRKRPVFGNPDFVFPQSKLAVFVDGCFWHGCRSHLRLPVANRDYWMQKISSNQIRDQNTVRALRHAGWRVLRIWEHELDSSQQVVRRLTNALSPSRKRVHIGCSRKVSP